MTGSFRFVVDGQRQYRKRLCDSDSEGEGGVLDGGSPSFASPSNLLACESDAEEEGGRWR